MNYHITPRLQTNLRGDWFYVNVSPIEGSMSEINVGLEYRLFRNIGLGAAFDRMSIDVNYAPENRTGWNVQGSWNAAMLYAALYL